MCLLVLSHADHDRYRFVFAGNRDEFHARPARPAEWWDDAPSVLAGRDLEAGGTWLGMTRTGRFAVITNFRESQSPAGGGDNPSRGALVREFLQAGVPAREFMETLHTVAPRYRGFSLIVGDGSELWFASNRADSPQRLERGVYGLSNDLLDVPWPKVVQAKTKLAEILAHEPSTSALLDMLRDRTLPHAPAGTSSSRLECAAAAIFVTTPSYGTRCSTAITITRDGDVDFSERSFDAEGNPSGEARFAFRLDPGGSRR